VVVLLGAALQLDVAVDLEDPGARAVARERPNGRDVAVPCRRRRVMPALRDDAGQAGAGDRRVAELSLDDRERLAVLRAGRRRQVGAATGTRRSPRRGRPRMRRRGGARAGWDQRSRALFYSSASPLTRAQAVRLRRKRVVFAQDHVGARALPAPCGLAIRAALPIDFAGNRSFPATDIPGVRASGGGRWGANHRRSW
jgi:hypothetical protein